MFKYLKIVCKVGFPILWAYFTWILPYSRHPERYSQEERFGRTRKLARKVLKAMKIEMDIRNVPELKEDEVYLFVGNHVSLLDAVILLAYSPVMLKFVSKVEVDKFPFVGRILRLVGGVLIERDNLKQELKVLVAVRESLASKETSWAIFPEGTRNRDYHAPLLPFKAGTFKAALATNTKVVPFVLNGTNLILSPHTRAKKFHVTYEFLDPIVPTGTTTELSNKVYALASEVNSRLKAEYPLKQQLNKYGRNIIDPNYVSKRKPKK